VACSNASIAAKVIAMAIIVIKYQSMAVVPIPIAIESLRTRSIMSFLKAYLEFLVLLLILTWNHHDLAWNIIVING
jgi:hypothetical protein